jgi:dTDP-4-amino-4,6-dideoxygalactose transaminase
VRRNGVEVSTGTDALVLALCALGPRRGEPVWHVYPVEVENRDVVRERLRELGNRTGVRYPTPIHLQPAYAHLGQGFGGVSEAASSAARVRSLPMHPELSDARVDRVAEALRSATEEA